MSQRFGYAELRGRSVIQSRSKTPRPQAVMPESTLNVSPDFKLPLNACTTRKVARSGLSIVRFLTLMTSAVTTNCAPSKFDFTRVADSSQTFGA